MKTGLEHENKKRRLPSQPEQSPKAVRWSAKRTQMGWTLSGSGTWSCHLLSRASMRSNAGRKRGTGVHHSGCTAARDVSASGERQLPTIQETQRLDSA